MQTKTNHCRKIHWHAKLDEVETKLVSRNICILVCRRLNPVIVWSRKVRSLEEMSNIIIYQLHRFTLVHHQRRSLLHTDGLSLIPPACERPYLELEKEKCGTALKMDQMFPEGMSIGEEDKTVQLVLIYGSIAILYLAVAYIMFFRSIFY